MRIRAGNTNRVENPDLRTKEQKSSLCWWMARCCWCRSWPHPGPGGTRQQAGRHTSRAAGGTPGSPGRACRRGSWGTGPGLAAWAAATPHRFRQHRPHCWSGSGGVLPEGPRNHLSMQTIPHAHRRQYCTFAGRLCLHCSQEQCVAACLPQRPLEARQCSALRCHNTIIQGQTPAPISA